MKWMKFPETRPEEGTKDVVFKYKISTSSGGIYSTYLDWEYHKADDDDEAHFPGFEKEWLDESE